MASAVCGLMAAVAGLIDRWLEPNPHKPGPAELLAAVAAYYDANPEATGAALANVRRYAEPVIARLVIDRAALPQRRASPPP